MCLAVPLKVSSVLSENEAVVEIDSLKQKVNTSLIGGVREGDYLIVHTGFAIQILDQAEALFTLKLFDEIAEMEQK